jgi:hypothetical protein
MTHDARLAAAILFVASSAVLGLQSLFLDDLLAGNLGDTDAFLRIAVLESHLLHGTPLDWSARDGAPHGVPLHWSRPPSWLFLAAAWPFRLAGLETRQALLLGAGLVQGLSPLLLALAMFWTLRSTAGPAAAAAAATLLLHVPTLGYAALHRPDHHLLVVLPAVLAAGLLLRGGPVRQIAAGALAGLSVWIHPEGLPLAALLLGAQALADLRHPGRGALLAGIGLVIVLALAVLLDPPTDGAHWAIDRHGPAHALAALAALPGLFLLDRPRKAVRMGGLIGAGFAAAATLLHAQPDLLRGSAALMDPDVKALWWDRIRELQPPGGGMILAHLALPVFGAAAAGLAARRVGPPHAVRLLLAAGAAVLLGIWTAGAARHTVLSAAAGAFALGLALPHFRRSLSQILPAAAVLIGLVGVGAAAVAPREDVRACPLSPDARTALAALPPSILLTPVDLAPEILLHTPHRTIAGPYQRNAAGIGDALRAFHDASPDAEVAHAILARRQASFVLACPGAPRAGALARRLGPDGTPPSWLAPVPLPDSRLTLHKILP